MLMSLMITSRFFDFERRENGFYVGSFTIILPSFYHRFTIAKFQA